MRRRIGGRLAVVMFLGAMSAALTGCGTLSQGVRGDSALLATASSEPPAGAPAPVVPASEASPLAALPDFPPHAAMPEIDGPAPLLVAVADTEADEAVLAQVREGEPIEVEEYDPWEPFNERMFEFNRKLDRWVLKPVAKGYNFVMPDELQIMISNGFDNIAFPPRFVNSVLQGKVGGAAREIGRFLINSTAGVGGLFDPAKDVFGLHKSREDFGQTLGFWGVGPGPYLVLPFLEPLTVRDGIGRFVDGFMDPLSYYIPFFWARFGMKVGDIVNERSLNLELFQGFEESVIDMYSAVRHAYLQRRERLIRE